MLTSLLSARNATVGAVSAGLMTGTRDKIEAIIDWSWDRFTKTGGPHVLDRGDAAEIDWEDDPTVLAPASASERPSTVTGQ